MSSSLWCRPGPNGGALALCAWLLLVGHVCAGAGDVHAEMIPIASHGSGQSHEDHAAGPADCCSIMLAVQQNQDCSPVVPDALVWHATSIPGIEAARNGSGVDRSRDPALAESGRTLFLLNSILLI